MALIYAKRTGFVYIDFNYKCNKDFTDVYFTIGASKFLLNS